MRSIVPRLEKPRPSASRAHPVSCWPVVAGTVLGSPIPMSMLTCIPRWEACYSSAAAEQRIGDGQTGVALELVVGVEQDQRATQHREVLHEVDVLHHPHLGVGLPP